MDSSNPSFDRPGVPNEKSKFDIDIPTLCDLTITVRCNFKCKMCHMWKRLEIPEDVTIEQWKNYIASLRRFVGNNRELVFVGGEPFLKKGILDLIKFAKHNGFIVRTTSNGFFIDKQMAKGIVDAGLDSVNLSLDSLNEKRHDFLRGISGSYKQLMEGIDHLSRCNNGLCVSISTIILQENLEDIVELAEWVHRDSRLTSINFQVIQQPFYAEVDEPWQKDDNFGFLWPKDIEKVHSVIDKLITMKEAGRPINNPLQQLSNYKLYFENPQYIFRESNCRQSERVVFVRPSGDVFFCPSHGSIGNIKYQDIGDIWYSDTANRVREEIKHCTKNCHVAINCFFEEEDEF